MPLRQPYKSQGIIQGSFRKYITRGITPYLQEHHTRYSGISIPQAQKRINQKKQIKPTTVAKLQFTKSLGKIPFHSVFMKIGIVTVNNVLFTILPGSEVYEKIPKLTIILIFSDKCTNFLKSIIESLNIKNLCFNHFPLDTKIHQSTKPRKEPTYTEKQRQAGSKQGTVLQHFCDNRYYYVK